MFLLLTLFRIRKGLLSGEIPAAGDEWPRFLYDDNGFDPNDPWKGFFRNPLLVKVYRCLLRCVDAVY